MEDNNIIDSLRKAVNSSEKYYLELLTKYNNLKNEYNALTGNINGFSCKYKEGCPIVWTHDDVIMFDCGSPSIAKRVVHLLMSGAITIHTARLIFV